MPQSRIQGVFTPNIVPLDSRGEINEAELRRYVDWLIERGVHGLYPNGSTGEFTRFTAEERRRSVEIIVDQVRGRVPVLAGAAEANVRETLKACEYYHRLGVRAVAIVSPFYYKLSPDSVYAYFSEIGRNTPVDVTLYNIPMFASPIDVPTIQRLAEKYERIVAIKDSSGDLSHLMRMIQAVRPNRPDFCFLTGWDVLLVPSLLMGCDGGTHATAGVVPEVMRLLYDLVKSGQVDAARQLQYKLAPLFDLMIGAGDFPEGFRAGLALRGIRPGAGRQPMTEDQRTKLSTAADQIAELLAEFDLRAESGGSSPVSATEPDKIDRIIREVLRDLSR